MGRNNKDDFDFDDDLFADDDDDLRSSAFGDDDDDFSFDDGDDIDSLNDFEDLNDDVDLSDDGDGEGRTGPNRTFILLAVVMIALFLIGLGLVIFLALREPPLSPEDIAAQTLSAAIFTENAGTIEAATQTAQALATDTVLTQTQAAIGLIATQTAAVDQLTQTAQSALVQTATAEFVQTQAAIPATPNAEQLAQTQTASALLFSPTPPTGPTATTNSNADVRSGDSEAFPIVTTLPANTSVPIVGISSGSGWYQVQLPDGSLGWIAPGSVTVSGDLSGIPSVIPPVLPVSTSSNSESVALTATALFEAFLTPVVQFTATPVQGGPNPSGNGTPPVDMPDTGLFDDVTGGQGMGTIMLVAVGLVGVIFGARRLRAANNKKS